MKDPVQVGNKALSQQDRAKLMAEMAAPYRGLRKFIYLGVGASGTIGAFVFFFRVLAGRDLATAVPSLALQLGLMAAAYGLVVLENRAQARIQERMTRRIQNQSTSQAPPILSKIWVDPSRSDHDPA